MKRYSLALKQMKLVTRSHAVLQILVISAATSWAVEPSDDVGRVASWLAAQSMTDRAMMPSSREFVPPAQVAISDRDSLKTLSVDSARTPFERIAALVLLGSDDTMRSAAIRTYFKETRDRIAPYHVHPVEWYLSALEHQAPKDAQDLPNPEAQSRLFGRFVAADMPLLVRMAILESDGMAMAALGLVGGERAAEALVYAPFVMLGDRGMSNANYQGLRFLCRDTDNRQWLKKKISQPGLSAPRRAMIVLALGVERDPTALEPLADLVRTLTRPAAEFPGDPSSGVRDPRYPILPPFIRTADVLDICAAWGDPRLDHALAEYAYAGSGAMEKAFIAARACGVALDKTRLLAVAAMNLPYWDAIPVLNALTPLLDADDSHNVASLLDPVEWNKQSFYTRVLWIAKVPKTVLTPDIRDALIAVTRKHPNPPVREWAIQALGRFFDPEAEQVLRQAEARGSRAAMRVLCERESDPGAAFLLRFADTNALVREAAYGLLQARFFGSSSDRVPGGLDPERRATILAHLLADWPGAESPPEQIEVAVQRLFMLVVDAPLNQPAQWNPELAATVVRRAEQTLYSESGQKHATRLLRALEWANTTEARKVVDHFAQTITNANLRTAAENTFRKMKRRNRCLCYPEPRPTP